MAQSIKPPTLDFSSGHAVMVHEIEPQVGLYTNSMGSAWGSLSLSLSVPPWLMLCLSLSEIK